MGLVWIRKVTGGLAISAANGWAQAAGNGSGEAVTKYRAGQDVHSSPQCSRPLAWAVTGQLPQPQEGTTVLPHG